MLHFNRADSRVLLSAAMSSLSLLSFPSIVLPFYSCGILYIGPSLPQLELVQICQLQLPINSRQFFRLLLQISSEATTQPLFEPFTEDHLPNTSFLLLSLLYRTRPLRTTIIMAKRSFSTLEAGTSSTKSPSGTPQRKKLCRPIRGGPRLGSNIITILAGDNEKAIPVHESALRSTSLFFNAALSHNWKERSERTIKLPTVFPAIVAVYVKWLYYGLFFLPTKDFNEVWALLYEFGDYIQDTCFKDAAIDALIEQMIEKNSMPRDLACFIYPFSTDGSPHRKLAIDCTLHLSNDPTTRALIDRSRITGLDLPEDFVNDILILWRPAVRMSVAQLFGGNDCRYHAHAGHEMCYKDRSVYKF